jgi:hypothetical protein
MKMLFEDSDDEIEEHERQPIVNRNALAGHEQLMNDYLVKNSVYSEKDFKRRFRVTKGIFIQLCNDLQTKKSTSYFIQRAVGHIFFKCNIFNLTSCFFLRISLESLGSQRHRRSHWLYDN